MPEITPSLPSAEQMAAAILKQCLSDPHAHKQSLIAWAKTLPLIQQEDTSLNDLLSTLPTQPISIVIEDEEKEEALRSDHQTNTSLHLSVASPARLFQHSIKTTHQHTTTFSSLITIEEEEVHSEQSLDSKAFQNSTLTI